MRTDTWLGPQPRIASAMRASSCCGGSSARSARQRRTTFAKWSGLTTSDSKRLVESAGGELAAVSVDGAPGWILRDDLPALAAQRARHRDAVTLLGAFDAFLLAHATKAHLVGARFYKRVYRPQGWISPVVLRGGTIAGVWFPETAGTRTTLHVELFTRATAALRLAIAREAEALERFLGTACAVRIK